MKHHPTARIIRWTGLFLFLICALATTAHAQGITVYSDTTSVLEDAATDTAQTSTAPFVSYSFPADEFFENNGWLDFLTDVAGATGILLFLFTIFMFLLPLVAIGLILYLIYRSSRNRKRNIEQMAYDPERKTVDEDKRNRLLKQSAIRYACWGIGMMAVEWIINFSRLLYVAGVILLCIAAGDWLSTLVTKKKDPH